VKDTLMRNVVVAIVLVSVLGGTAFCSNTSKIQIVSIKGSGNLSAEAVSGYLALPSGPGRHPGIIAFHENWGIRDWMKQRMEELAGQGYVALAVDLYHGKLPENEAEGEEMSRTLSRARAYRDSKTAFDYLAGRKEVDPRRIGAIGWAMGGRYAIQLAVQEPRLAACVDNYGQFPLDPSQIERIKAPVLAIFGADDPEFKPDMLNALASAMRAAGKSLELKVYNNASHEFLDPDLPRRDAEGRSLYRYEAAQDASKQISAFFAKTLGLASPGRRR
jgi:carboxymethylenebutenolidase